MSRSIWKIPFVSPRFLTKRFKFKKVVFVWKRNSLIGNNFTDKTFKIYNGSCFVMSRLKSQHVNLRLGQLSSTITFEIYKKK